MTVARTVADVLADHVVFEVECIDRMYCNVYVPNLQYAGGLLGYVQFIGCCRPQPGADLLGKTSPAVTCGVDRACASTKRSR
jgi:hypothetical protein